jgi:chromosomal replication initiation ATPase DnaA
MLVRSGLIDIGSDRRRRKFQRLRNDPEAFALVKMIAGARGVTLTALMRRSRGHGRAAAARQFAVYLTHVLLERPQDVVAELFGRDRTTIAHACHLVEDMREKPEVEAEIARIEARWLRNDRFQLEYKHAA